MGKALQALNSGHSFDFRWEKHPRCPHCGATCDIDRNDWYHLYEEGEHEVECPLCDLPFAVSTHVEFTFSTDEQGDFK